MHVVLALIGVLAAGACWWCRAKYIGQAAAAIVDAAERARGAVRRRQFRRKAEASPIASIDDPRTAAVVLMVAIATWDGRLSEASERRIRAAMQSISVDRSDEELVFAKWATSDLADLNNLVARLSPLWKSRLNAEEKRELYEMVTSVAFANGTPDDARISALRKLKDRLGLAQPVI